MKRLALVLLLGLPAALPAGWALQALGGLASPLSPLGTDSFATAHKPGAAGWGRALWTSGDWELGLEGMDQRFGRIDGAGAVSWWQAGAVAVWGFSLDEVAKDRVVLSLGAGWAGVDADAPLVDRQWSAAAGSLGLGYELPLNRRFDLLFNGMLWGVLGPGDFDPLLSGGIGLGLAFKGLGEDAPGQKAVHP